MNGSRAVLMVAYFFPPLGGAGVQRSLKFVKYLPQFGWHAVVVTTRERRYPVEDESLVDEIPADVRVIRVGELSWPRQLVRHAQMLCDVLRAPRLKHVVAWPDEFVGWGPPALLRTLREIRRERPDVIFTTSAPFTAHFVGLIASRLTGVPWVADFRDEWSTNPHVAAQGRIVTALSRRAERLFVRAAKRVSVVADYFEMAPTLDGRRVTITNGVDPDDVPNLASHRSVEDRFRLAFVGTLYGDRDAAPVLRALDRLVERGDIDPACVELRVVGNVWLETEWPVETTTTGYVSHARAFAEMAAATALLLYVPPGSLAPGGKLYEYLVSGRPVLCVAPPDNLAARLVEEWGAGRSAAPDDDAAIEAAILDLYRSWHAGSLHVAPDVRARTLERFGRPQLARELARVLDEASRT
jgi:glycosyltransferase involved in cell wall biosynthesis